jgi:hypothetical protein
MHRIVFGSIDKLMCVHAVIRVYDEAGNVLETHDRTGDFKEW